MKIENVCINRAINGLEKIRVLNKTNNLGDKSIYSD